MTPGIEPTQKVPHGEILEISAFTAFSGKIWIKSQKSYIFCSVGDGEILLLGWSLSIFLYVSLEYSVRGFNSWLFQLERSPAEPRGKNTSRCGRATRGRHAWPKIERHPPILRLTCPHYTTLYLLYIQFWLSYVDNWRIIFYQWT